MPMATVNLRIRGNTGRASVMRTMRNDFKIAAIHRTSWILPAWVSIYLYYSEIANLNFRRALISIHVGSH